MSNETVGCGTTIFVTIAMLVIAACTGILEMWLLLLSLQLVFNIPVVITFTFVCACWFIKFVGVNAVRLMLGKSDDFWGSVTTKTLNNMKSE